MLICWFHKQDYFIPLIYGFRIMSQHSLGVVNYFQVI